MNRTKLKNYAPQARRDFIQAMTDRAAFYGLTAQKTDPVVERGDVAVIAGREHPRAVVKKRKRLEDRIQRYGFEQTMEAMAYTWFNRLVAIRFMELHGYLDHGFRVLSHPEGKLTPEILEQAEHVELPGLKKELVIDLKLAGNKEGELYRLLLTAQCNALHTAMPFLFERIDDETELLLPDNLLHSDSLIRTLVSEIDEEDWKEVEIIGWLYQFYISEKKDEVIGKVVASEDIPAATQLFTPNWIVKYLVQNTLGRQWLATYPQSALHQQMRYYIEPAEQTPEVQEQLKAITPTSLNPEELKLLDPASGSGHILVEAYDLFKAIYQERGYRAKDIPALILQKNLFGLEIDDRAAQLAAFALMMKARADDRRIFESEAKPNILAFQDSKGLDAASITNALNSPITNVQLPRPTGEGRGEGKDENHNCSATAGLLPIMNKDVAPRQFLFEEMEEKQADLFGKQVPTKKGHVSQADIASLLELFENAKTFGSLIQVPPKLAAKLPEIWQRLDDVLKQGDLTHTPAQVIKPLLQQARMLARQYDAVVANPPYMGRNAMNSGLKDFAKKCYVDSKADLFAMFMERSFSLAKLKAYIGMITMQGWMFLSSFEALRSAVLTQTHIVNMLHLGPRAFDSIGGEVVQTAAFVLQSSRLGTNGMFVRLVEGNSEAQKQELLQKSLREGTRKFTVASSRFDAIPGKPIAYWASDTILSVFTKFSGLKTIASARQGLATSDNNQFVRVWQEVALPRICFNAADRTAAKVSGARWFPFNKGGTFRKWYGNQELVVNWENDGAEIKHSIVTKYPYLNGNPDFVAKNPNYYFKPGLTWSALSSGNLSVRVQQSGFIFADKGQAMFAFAETDVLWLQGFLNCKVSHAFLACLSPTLDFNAGYLGRLPVISVRTTPPIVEESIRIARAD